MEVLVGRQPILDRQQRTVAYELLFRSGMVNAFDGSDGRAATRAVVSNTFLTIGCEQVLGGKRGFINFPRACLVGDSPLLLPRDRIVVEVLEDVPPDVEVLDACRRLKQAGYTIALDDVVKPEDTSPFLEYAQIAKLELPAMSALERHRACDFYLNRGIRTLAEKVESRSDFEAAFADGCDLFQGFFFARPEIVSGKQVPVSKTTCLRLINEVQQLELDFDKLERIVRLDIGLTRKLLCLVNSAVFGSREHVGAIGQAFVRLGETNIRRWVTIAALPALATGRPAELVSTSLVRARFCERAAETLGDRRSGGYFLTGLLSQLDSMIGRPLGELLADMALDPAVAGSILGEPGAPGRMRSALELAKAFERADFESVERLSAQTGIASNTASQLYVEAMSWADSLPR